MDNLNNPNNPYNNQNNQYNGYSYSNQPTQNNAYQPQNNGYSLGYNQQPPAQGYNQNPMYGVNNSQMYNPAQFNTQVAYQPPQQKKKSPIKIFVFMVLGMVFLSGSLLCAVAMSKSHVSPSESLRDAFELAQEDDNNYHIINTYKALCVNDCDTDPDNKLYYFNQLNDEEKVIYNCMDYAVKNYDALVVPVPDEYLLKDDFVKKEYQTTIYNVELFYEYDHPEYYWAYSSDSYYVFDNYFYSDFHYSFSDEEVGYTDSELDRFEKDNLEFNSQVNSAVAELQEQTDGMDEWDKAFAVFEWVCDNTSYDLDIYEKIADDEYFDEATNKQYDEILLDGGIYGAVTKGTTVCRGYAMLYQILANGIGLECTYVPGYSNFYQSLDEELNIEEDEDDSGHAWNMVKIDGCYVNVDATNGDLEEYNEPRDYFYFCMDDASTEGSYIREDNIDLPDCDSPELNYCQHEGLYSSSVNSGALDNSIKYSLEHGYNTAIVQYSCLDDVNEASDKFFSDSEVLADLLLKYNKSYDSQIDIDETGYYYTYVDEDFNVLIIYLTYDENY